MKIKVIADVSKKSRYGIAMEYQYVGLATQEMCQEAIETVVQTYLNDMWQDADIINDDRRYKGNERMSEIVNE